MRAYILSIGSELILGHLSDTNATFLAQDLAASGIDLLHVTQVGDDRNRLVATLNQALSLAELVVCTGGIGPTDDDLTREAIADVLGEQAAIDPVLLDEVQSFFAHRGLTMPERNAKQAWLIPSAVPLPNPIGTAPGWFVQVPGESDRLIVAMPGVPREMHRMWREQALPRILPFVGGNIIDSVTLKTIGIGESAAEQAIHDLVVAERPVVATYAKDDGVHIRVTATGVDREDVRSCREAAVATIQERLGEYIWGEGDDTLADVLLRRLSTHSDHLSVFEAGTGGSFVNLLSGSTLADDVLLPCQVVPAKKAGQVSAEDLAARAAGATGVSIGMGVVLSVDGATAGRVEGQVTIAIAAAGDDLQASTPLAVRSGLADAHRRAALHASDTLRRFLFNREH